MTENYLTEATILTSSRAYSNVTQRIFEHYFLPSDSISFIFRTIVRNHLARLKNYGEMRYGLLPKNLQGSHNALPQVNLLSHQHRYL